uniref:hypothetical protein n=1 Tax=Bacillus glycinifermentans TaxID=1664069 RepID=UPI0009E28B09|nr:hypothetical protein [Bacillus glycinifermentans]
MRSDIQQKRRTLEKRACLFCFFLASTLQQTIVNAWHFRSDRPDRPPNLQNAGSYLQCARLSVVSGFCSSPDAGRRSLRHTAMKKTDAFPMIWTEKIELNTDRLIFETVGMLSQEGCYRMFYSCCQAGAWSQKSVLGSECHQLQLIFSCRVRWSQSGFYASTHNDFAV